MFETYFNIKSLTAAILFTAIVLILTHIPKEVMPSQLQENSPDKLYHVVAYGAITFLFILSLKSSPSILSSLFVFFALLAIGIVDEITQPLVNREASLTDLAANVIGIVTVLLFSTMRRRRFLSPNP